MAKKKKETVKENRGGRKNPKEYMKLAVEVMKQSIHERKRNNPSPYVGAVLVFPNGTYDTAYRGEYREGAHAEYVVLDRKNRNKDLSGCWLFATLEPCAPGARNAPKVSCAQRIVDARISEVWFGIEDKNPTVNHAGINHLLEHKVKVRQFAPEFHKIIAEANREFMKWANMQNEKSKKTQPLDNLSERANSTDMDSLSEIALQKFITESKRKYKPKSAEQLRELKEMDLLEYDNKKRKYLPTGNAILLFGNAPRNKFPQAAVKAKVHYGDGKTGTETFDTALVLVPDEVENWLKKVLPATIDRSKFKAQQVPSFPIEVIREAVINAIAHRDYDKDGAKVQLEVFPDRIIVKSPGKPPEPITIESMKNFTATSYSRNKKLTFIFNEMDYMEETALGMDTFKSMRSDHQLPLPIIDYDGLNVVVTFPRTLEAVKEVAGKAIGHLTEEVLKGYEWIRSKNEVSAKEYSKHLGITTRTTSRHLSKMLKLKLVKTNNENPKSPKLRYKAT